MKISERGTKEWLKEAVDLISGDVTKIDICLSEFFCACVSFEMDMLPDVQPNSFIRCFYQCQVLLALYSFIMNVAHISSLNH